MMFFFTFNQHSLRTYATTGPPGFFCGWPNGLELSYGQLVVPDTWYSTVSDALRKFFCFQDTRAAFSAGVARWLSWGGAVA